MDFKEKIDKILINSNMKLSKLARESGLGNTLEKAYAENREMRQGITDKFLQKLLISRYWWETGQGPIHRDVKLNVEDWEKGLYGIADQKNKKNLLDDMEEVYKNIVEGRTEYILIPRSVLQEKYRLVSIEQIEKDKETLEKDRQFMQSLIDTNKELMKQLNALLAK